VEWTAAVVEDEKRGATFGPVEEAIFPEARRGRKSQRFSQAFGSCGGISDWLDSMMAGESPIHSQSSGPS
jgi:hypothetical protein